MDIVYTSSDSYMKYTGVSIQSLYENNIDTKIINVYVLSSDISENSINNLKQIAGKFDRKITVKDISKDLSNFASKLGLKPFRGSYAVYASLFIEQIFPDLDRVIYLDADTLINSSLEGLWNKDIGSSPIAAVPEIGLYSGISSSEDNEILYGSDIYYNTGFILYNLCQWREQKINNIIESTIDSYGKPFRIVDQSIINLALKNKIFRLHLKYNYYTAVHAISYERMVKTFSNNPIFKKKEFDSARESPCVIHFVGLDFERPWFRRGFSAYKDLYLSFLEKTPWSGDKPEEFSTSKSFVYKIYDEFSLILLNLKLYNFYHWYRYIFGQKIKKILNIKR